MVSDVPFSMFALFASILLQFCSVSIQLSGVRPPPMEGDDRENDCCGCNQTALMQTVRPLGMEAHVHIVYSSWANTTLLKPYSIAVDSVMRAVVISVRGTLSIDDAITDVLAGEQDLSGTFAEMLGRPLTGTNEGLSDLRVPEYSSSTAVAFTRGVSVKVKDSGDDGWKATDGEYVAHQGILRSALAIVEHCDAHGVLPRLISAVDTADYRLVVTGHSLGAGVAQMLAMLLRAQFASAGGAGLREAATQIHCYAYSPPGGMLSIAAAKKTRGYITSFVLGDDMVSRLSVRTMQQLRDHALELLCYTPANKNKILGAACCRAVSCKTLLQRCGCSSASARARSAAKQARLIAGSVAVDHEDGGDGSTTGIAPQKGGEEWIEQRQQLIVEGKLTYSRRMFIAGTTLHATPHSAISC